MKTKKIDRHSFLDYIAPKSLDTEKKCLYTNKTKGHTISSFTLKQMYGKKKGAKRGSKPKEQNCEARYRLVSITPVNTIKLTQSHL